MSEPAPPDPALVALYAAERSAPGASAADRQRIRAQVLATVGVAAAASAPGTASAAIASSTATTGAEATAAAGGTAGTVTGVAGSTGKLVALVLALGAVGGGTAALLAGRSEDSPRIAHDVPQRAPGAGGDAIVHDVTPTGEPISVESEGEAEDLQSAQQRVQETDLESQMAPAAGRRHTPTLSSSRVLVPNTSSRRSAGASSGNGSSTHRRAASASMGAPTASAPESAHDDTRTALAQAWKRLSRGDAEGSLAILERLDAWPAGHASLVEERDALIVLALARAGRSGEARERAEVFLARFPSSIHRAAIESELESATDRALVDIESMHAPASGKPTEP